MTRWIYLATLLVPLVCLLVMDARWRLAFWHAPGRAAFTVIGAGAVFLVWDVVAISAGFYHRGGSAAMTGLEVLPELPIEELVFITFLCYLALIVFRLLGRSRIAAGEPGRNLDQGRA
ncbi:lycopene cyclase domain-containing protein [Ruania halotolerans]|uniref:lycopene cyclase domain-containing protein n=1 Tax=Ruania halotolerans TaxID=2897773 RepID=UPI001E3DA673|nr:lycopene cyclase domain-containing protein [Ruania halotolerans]UFU06874.1 lycopene cyclase domain-containing protein [Ruania halotolerans]